MYIRTNSLFGLMPVCCALLCVSCDLPALRKVCGFTSYSALHGCSKCMKVFPCEAFGEKLTIEDTTKTRGRNGHMLFI